MEKNYRNERSFAHQVLTEQLYPSNRTSTRSLVVETKTSSLLDVGPKTTSKVKVWSLRTALFKSRCRFCFLPILIQYINQTKSTYSLQYFYIHKVIYITMVLFYLPWKKKSSSSFFGSKISMRSSTTSMTFLKSTKIIVP